MADVRQVGAVADTAQPAMHLHQVGVGTKEAGDQDNGGAATVGNAKAAVNGRGA